MVTLSLEKPQQINPPAGYVRTGAWVGVKTRNKMFLLGSETLTLGS